MRFTPASIALAFALAVVSSAGNGQRPDSQINPLSIEWMQKGQAAQAAGNLSAAVDAFETSVAVDPRNRAAYVAMGRVSQAQGLNGKAIRLYREALLLDPTDVTALAGQGEAMAQKGAIEKAKENLAKVQTLCRTGCPQVAQLNAAIEKGRAATLLTAKDVSPAPVKATTEQP